MFGAETRRNATTPPGNKQKNNRGKALPQPGIANPVLEPAPEHDRPALSLTPIIAVVGVRVVQDRVPPSVKPLIDLSTPPAKRRMSEATLQMPPGQRKPASFAATVVAVIWMRFF